LELITKTDQFCTSLTGKARTVQARDRDRVCDCWAVLKRKRQKEQEYYYEKVTLFHHHKKKFNKLYVFYFETFRIILNPSSVKKNINRPSPDYEKSCDTVQKK